MIDFWTTDRVTQLQDLWLRKSASEIAAIIGATRDAVLGKAHRLGLDSKRRPRKPLSRSRVVATFSSITQTRIASRCLQISRKPEPTKNQLRAMLADAVRNTAVQA